jgi:hypothetical protein
MNPPDRSAELLYRAALDAGVPVRLQYCDGAVHGKVIDHCADEYADWVVSFFRDAFAPRRARAP